MRTPWCTLTRASLSGTRAAVLSRFCPMVSPSSATGLAPCTYEGSLAPSMAASLPPAHPGAEPWSRESGEGMADWEDETGLVTLPGGARVRGRRLGDPASPADFALVLGKGAPPAWPCRRVRWPDFGVPADRGDALDALGEAHRRALAGERVEVACRGGVGR